MVGVYIWSSSGQDSSKSVGRHCDHSDSIGENGNCGSGYSQCSNYAIEKSSGSLAIYNNKGEGDLQLENYQFKVDILHSGGTHASVGVVFRYQDSKNYYRVVLTSWCTTLIRVTNGKSTKITGHYKSKGKVFKRRERAIAYMESTVVDISIKPPSFKPVALFLSRSPLF